MRTQLPQRAANPRGSASAGSADFTAHAQSVAPEGVASDMHDLAERVRNLMDLRQGQVLHLP
jgi:hypothetical protein